MPELPEVETVRRGLAGRVLGRPVAGVEVLHPRSVRRQPGGAAELAGWLAGQTFTAAVRRGKYLWLTLGETPGSPPDQALVVHLGMSGQLLVQEPAGSRRTDAPSGSDGSGASAEPGVPPRSDGPAGSGASAGNGTPPGSVPAGTGVRTDTREAPRSRLDSAAEYLARDGRPVDLTVTLPPTVVRDIPLTTAHLRVRIDLADGGQLWFVDQRTFGHVMAVGTVPTADGAPGGLGSDAAVVPTPVAHIARDLLDPALDRRDLVRRTRARRTEIKRALLDQTLVSGVGNIYADEALWRARLHGTRRTDVLRPDRLRALFDAATDVMGEALAVGGTSFDALYVDVDGAAGFFARSLAVYGRAGRPCPRCGALVRREEFMNRGSFSCPRCQRRPALPR